MQTNVFAWLCTVFAHLIVGCAIQYPKTGNLHYITGTVKCNSTVRLLRYNHKYDNT